ncbi:hypothetical protein [Gloeobacter morelensis]|uniref:Uncharacterized protein n=1 Tax=Gloeobacter morelensis MG652769 TaxID=2781736 RepID=A0ABY3PSW4_9CYAN|nr:hypothetical protein [Gloeobacter morelensis]UFP96838.1 hypothetical protein ISF26_11785 [Gloeobacter morelensis MG652769]
MDELRSLDQIELDNPGFGLSRRYDREGVEYAIFYRAAVGSSRHVHCRDKNQIQAIIDRLRAARERGD